MSTATSHIYKITTSDLWATAQQSGIVPRAPIDDADGFMHLSSASQLAETLSLHFKGQSELFVLQVRVDGLGDKLVWETSRGGALFPHLFAPLNLSQVTAFAQTSVGPEGQTDLPDWVK